MHAVVALFDWYRPFVQLSQLVSRASSGDAVPTLQSTHLLCSTLDWYLPGMQFKQAVVPLFAWYRPFVQLSQLVSRASSGDAVPTLQSTHLFCSRLDWYLPGIQFKQDVVPVFDWY